MSELSPNVGVVGTHVRQSLSPVMHNAAYQEMGLDLRYGVFELPEVEDKSERADMFDRFLEQQAEAGVLGLSVTMPFKEDVMLSGEIATYSEGAIHIKAANTLLNFAGWRADNTDWVGAVTALEEAGVEIKDKTALVIGAGGTARAVVYGFGMKDVEQVTIANRTLAKAQALAVDLRPVLGQTKLSPCKLDDLSGAEASAAMLELARRADILFNTTNIGQDGTSGADRLPVPADVLGYLSSKTATVDAVYMPLRTPLLRFAAECGHITINGTRMLLHQAVEQVRIFTGIQDVPVAAMDGALQQEIIRRRA